MNVIEKSARLDVLADEDCAAELATKLLEHLHSVNAEFGLDVDEPWVLIGDQCISLRPRRGNLALDELMIQVLGITSFTRAARIAIRRVCVLAAQEKREAT